MKVITETERLIIREIGEPDIDAMVALHSDPEVHLYLADELITSHMRMLEILEWLHQQYADFGVGRWAMISKQTNEFIGWTGLEFVTKKINKHTNFYDLGYRLLRKYWGQGYATESAIASIEYGFEVLKVEKVFAMADIKNIGSNKILEKIGMNFIENFDFDGIAHNWYELGRLEYNRMDG